MLNPKIIIKPKRWWWPPDYKKAKTMTLLMNHIYEQNKVEIEKKIMEDIRMRMIYGEAPTTQTKSKRRGRSYVDTAWDRIMAEEESIRSRPKPSQKD